MLASNSLWYATNMEFDLLLYYIASVGELGWVLYINQFEAVIVGSITRHIQQISEMLIEGTLFVACKKKVE